MANTGEIIAHNAQVAATKWQAADIIKQCTPTSLEEERGHVSERKQL